MRQSRTKIARVIADKTLRGVDSKSVAREAAAYLLSERRVGDLSSVARDIQAFRAQAGYVEVLASGSHILTDEIKQQIRAVIKDIYPRATEIIITETHDPTIIGGVRLNLADKQLDLSLRAKLNKFKQLTTTGKE